MPRQHHPAAGSRGFSLVELLLSVVLLMLLLGAVAYNFSSLQRGAQLDEGVTQLEALLRFAKAQAANTGKKVQVRFQETASTSGDTNQASSISVQVLWEPDPLGQPGIFEKLPEGNQYADSINDLVTIENVQSINGSGELVGPVLPSDPLLSQSNPSSVNPLEESQETGPKSADSPAAAQPMPSIEFFPDGSCDTAQITVVSRDSEDTRRTAVRLVATGELKRQPMPTDDADTIKPSDAAPALSKATDP